MTNLIIAGVILMILVFFAVRAWDSRATDKRSTDLEPAAAALSMDFQASPAEDPLGALPRFPLFARGRDPRASNLLSGQHGGLQARIFDFSYLEGTGSQRDRYRQTVVYLDTSGKLRLPEFSMRNKTIADRVAGALGNLSPIDLGGDFAGQYVLTGPDEAAIRQLFSASVVGFFKEHPGLDAESAGNALLLYRWNVLAPPGSLSDLLEEGQELADVLARVPGR